MQSFPLTGWPSWDFDVASELLGIHYSLTRATRRYFGPTNEPQIYMQWLKMNKTCRIELDDIDLKRFFFYFISSFLLGNNRLVLTYMLLGAIRAVSNIGAYDWGSLSYGIFITLLRQAF